MTASKATLVVTALAITMTACSGNRHAPSGSLTSNDLGPGWIFTGAQPSPTMDTECEALAFTPDATEHVVPDHVVKTDYVRQPNKDSGGPITITEYAMQFGTAARAEQALRSYAQVAGECSVGGDMAIAADDQHVVQKTDRYVLSSRTSVGFVISPGAGTAGDAYWLDFVIAGDRAVWLMVAGGTQHDVEQLADRAVARR